LDRSGPDPSGALERRVDELAACSAADDAAEQTAALLAAVGAALVERSGNAVLCSIMSTVMDRTQLIRRLALDTPERISLVRLRAEAWFRR
jgi:hypothetical protein